MTRDRLRARLLAEGVRPDAFSLGDADAGEDEDCDEAYALRHEGGAWHTFYAERGERNDERRFDTEAEACAHLYAWIKRDPTVLGPA